MEGLFAPWHILIVVLVGLLVLGPKQLPQAGRQVARAFGEVRRLREALQNETRSLFDATTDPTPHDPPPGPTIEQTDPSEVRRSDP